MADIRFDTGVKDYNINDALTVRFCPTDMVFIERVYMALDNMDKKQEAYQADIKKATNAEVFDLARRIDADVRNELNAVFGFDVCTPLVGEMSMCAVADGFPIWANFLLAIIDQLEGEFAAEKKKTNPRIQRYTAKYKR